MFSKNRNICYLISLICMLAYNSVYAKAYTYNVSGSLPTQLPTYQSPVTITVTITNTSGGSYGLGATVTGDRNWSITSNTCIITQSLANGASCQIQGEFNPKYINNQSQLSLDVTIYPGVKITPVVMMQTQVTQENSLNITPIQQTSPALYSGLQVTNVAPYSQVINITNNTTSNPEEIIPCTYASGINECPLTLSNGLCPADEGGTITLAAGQSCNLWYVAQTNIISSDNGNISLTLTPNSTQAVNASFNFAYFSSLYAGGSFIATIADDPVVNRIASWVNGKWSKLDYGFNNQVIALASDQNGNLYAGGTFSTACTIPDCSTYTPTQHIAVWNGTAWQSLGTGIIGTSVSALAFDANHNRMYVGGNFSIAGGVVSPNIAYWDIELGTWIAVPDPEVGGTINALAYDNVNNLLYAGGNFTGHIAVWDGTSWTILGSGLNNIVNSISLGSIVSGARNVMLGGRFTDTISPYLVLWNGSNFVATVKNPDQRVNALATLSTSNGDDTYFGGIFINVGGVGNTYNRIGNVSYNNSSFSFSPLSVNNQPGLNLGVSAVAILGINTVLIGGNFTQSTSGSTLNKITEWNGTNWVSLSQGFDNVVFSILSVPTILIS